MYNIEYSEEYHRSLKGFIDSYTKAGVQMFSDTGIENEALIRENYIAAGRELLKSIKSKNLEILQDNVVLGRTIERDTMYLKYVLGNFRVQLSYTEDTENTTKYIENIIFTKK